MTFWTVPAAAAPGTWKIAVDPPDDTSRIDAGALNCSSTRTCWFGSTCVCTDCKTAVADAAGCEPARPLTMPNEMEMKTTRRRCSREKSNTSPPGCPDLARGSDFCARRRLAFSAAEKPQEIGHHDVYHHARTAV